jgi:hypothetical protein
MMGILARSWSRMRDYEHNRSNRLYETGHCSQTSQAMNCLATIVVSLRDNPSICLWILIIFRKPLAKAGPPGLSL